MLFSECVARTRHLSDMAEVCVTFFSGLVLSLNEKLPITYIQS